MWATFSLRTGKTTRTQSVIARPSFFSLPILLYYTHKNVMPPRMMEEEDHYFHFLFSPALFTEDDNGVRALLFPRRRVNINGGPLNYKRLARALYILLLFFLPTGLIIPLDRIV